MWTICWSDSRGDHWDRGSAERLMDIIRSNRIDPTDEDVLIFSPGADDCTVPITKFIADNGSMGGIQHEDSLKER